MKNKIYILTALFFSFFEIANAQTPAITPDRVASPSIYNYGTCATSGTTFPAPANYSPTPATVQLGVNNTGTDLCQKFGDPGIFQAMVWDNVTSITSGTNFTSTVYLSWNYTNSTTGIIYNGSVAFAPVTGETGGFDPDVAIYSDSSGTYIQIVFENNTTGKIDGYTYQWNTATSTFIPYFAYKSTLYHDATKKAKNPNIAVSKRGTGIAVVWHEEGLANPGPSLTITYSTTPPIVTTLSLPVLQSKVYIYCADKLGLPASDLMLGSATTTYRNFAGIEVIRTSSNNNHLFDRNFNPDVSISEDIMYPSTGSLQRGISVTFLSQWFDPSSFSIVTGQLSVVQGIADNFNNTTPSSVQTSTYNFTTLYSGKPRIASRLTFSGVNTAKDFSVVMGNSSTLTPCGAPTAQASKINYWWFQNGDPICPAGGVDILQGTPYSSVVAVDPVISCIHGKGFYNVTFSAINSTSNGFDIMANTFKEGAFVNTSTFSLVNYGACTTTTAGNQVLPSVASIRPSSSLDTDYAFSNYLFWDQNNKTLDYKKTTNNNVPGVTGTGAGLKQAQTQNKEGFTVYPNPSDNEILFDFKLEKDEIPSEIEIFNMIGQSVDKFSIEENSTEQKRDVNKIPSGTYIAVLRTNGKDYKLEFIKR